MFGAVPPAPIRSLIYIRLWTAIAAHDAKAAFGRSCGRWRHTLLLGRIKTVGRARIKGKKSSKKSPLIRFS